jgi:predicted XRE-type DNA-binding protein
MSVNMQPTQLDPHDLSLRHMLIAAINQRIADKQLTAAQAAAVLGLTGPAVTQLLADNAKVFTVEELAAFLPYLELAIRVVPEAQR